VPHLFRYHDYLKVLAGPGSLEDAEVPYWLEGWDPDAFNKEDIQFDNPYKRWKYAFLGD
jgi:hypothetical protein